MNAPTEKERALANLRHLYQQMAGGQVKDSAQAKRIADGLLSPAIAKLEQAARRDPAVPVPQFSRIAQKKLDYLLEAGEAITGYAIENKDGRRGAIDCHGFVYWWQDAAAPQPPACNPSMQPELATYSAPVQLPEPVAKVEDGGLKWHVPDSRYSLPVRYLQGTHKLYTEQQVRELLANHGIQEQST